MARIRSPNYPQVELGQAIDLVGKIFKEEAQNFAPREVVAELLGYSSVSGASEKKVSAITAYGLLERNAERELRVSDLAVSILHPEDEAEKERALEEAALSPNLFQEIGEKWPDAPPSDSNLKSYLIRRGFNQNSVDQVVSVYRDTMAMISQNGVDDVAVDDHAESNEAVEGHNLIAEAVIPQTANPAKPTLHWTVDKPIIFDMETVSGNYCFDNAEDLQDFINKLSKIKDLLPEKH